MSNTSLTLATAASIVEVDRGVLRAALNRLGLRDRQEDGQRTVPIEVVDLFRTTRRASGFLYPRGIHNRAALIAAANRLAEPAV